MLKFQSRPWIIGLLICGFAMPVWAQGNEMSLDDAVHGYEATTHQTFQGVVDDWSTHHVVFSRPEPGSETEYRVQRDGRYWLQQNKEKMPAAAATYDLGLQSDFGPPPKKKKKKPVKPKGKLKNDWSVNMGSGAKVGAGQYPAKFQLRTGTAPLCTDYVVFNTGLAGSATQASILAFDNLYATTCTGTVPTVYWAFNTGGTVVTAPALSPDGTQVAFVQSSSAGVASLVLLKWKAASGTLAAPDTLTAVATTAYRACTAPCMTTIAFHATATTDPTPNDTNSFPFYDYSGSDQLFAGDNSGYLHKFTGVFNGTPAEVVTATEWPAAVSTPTGEAGQALSTPVYDPNSQLAFVGDGHEAGNTTDGHVHSVSSTGTVTTSGPAGDALCHGIGFAEGPLLDPTAGASGTLYIGCDHDAGGGNCPTSGDYACVRQFAETGLTGNGIGIGEELGTQADAEMYAGAFDYKYLTSTGGTPAGSAPTGHLYFCGNPGGTVSLYEIPITSNVMGTPVLVHALSSSSATAGTEGSPITEFYNRGTSTDWLFMSEPNTADMAVGTCTTTSTGCVYSYNVTTAPVAGATATAGLASTDGSSGIIVDNSSTATGASQVYFSTLGNGSCGGGCAIQAAQSTL